MFTYLSVEFNANTHKHLKSFVYNLMKKINIFI